MGSNGSFPIKNQAAFVSMISLGIIIILVGLILMGQEKVEDYLVSVVGFTVVVVGLIEIGVKRLTQVSDLNKLGTQQIVGVIILSFVLVTSILMFPGIGEIPFVTGFMKNLSSGSFIVSGMYLIVEALR